MSQTRQSAPCQGGHYSLHCNFLPDKEVLKLPWSRALNANELAAVPLGPFLVHEINQKGSNLPIPLAESGRLSLKREEKRTETDSRCIDPWMTRYLCVAGCTNNGEPPTVMIDKGHAECAARHHPDTRRPFIYSSVGHWSVNSGRRLFWHGQHPFNR